MRIICFSKNRPLQLHGYLSSLMRMAQQPEKLSVCVLIADPHLSEPAARATEYVLAYNEVRRDFPKVRFMGQLHFASDVASLVDQADPYTSFGVDDAIYHRPFDHEEAIGLFEQWPDLIGVSLRLGRNIRRSMFYGDTVLPQPPFDATEPFLVWSVNGAQYDWNYPWEMDGTIYRTQFVRDMLAQIGTDIHTPNQLEHVGSMLWPVLTTARSMAAYPTSRLVVPTVNVVQHDFPNRPPGVVLPTDYLLECWQRGVRIDPSAYDADYASVHIGELYVGETLT